MRRRMVVWVVAMVLAAIGIGHADPPSGALDRAGLEAEAAHNNSLRYFLKHNGMPDAAEVRPIFDEAPWDNYEVAVYYFGEHKGYGFARARILSQPTIQTHRFVHTLSDADIQSIQAHLPALKTAAAAAPVKTAADTAPTPTCGHSAVARAECAADQAERAAQRVEVAAERAERAADRTEAVVAKMAAPAPRHRAASTTHGRRVATRANAQS